MSLLNLVSRPRNTMTFADGSCEGRSRSGEDDAGTSAMTSGAEIARNPHQPEGWRRDGIYFFVANSTPSRSPQTSPYLWNEALTHGSVCPSLTPTPGVLRCSVRAAGFSLRAYLLQSQRHSLAGIGVHQKLQELALLFSSQLEEHQGNGTKILVLTLNRFRSHHRSHHIHSL